MFQSYDPVNGTFSMGNINTETRAGTLFFITVNSNRVSDGMINVNSTDDAINSMTSAIETFINVDNVEGNIKKIETLGEPQIGPNLQRVHAHMLVNVHHVGGRYKMNLNRIKEHFAMFWGVDDNSIHLNVKVGKTNNPDIINMRDYILSNWIT